MRNPKLNYIRLRFQHMAEHNSLWFPVFTPFVNDVYYTLLCWEIVLFPSLLTEFNNFAPARYKKKEIKPGDHVLHCWKKWCLNLHSFDELSKVRSKKKKMMILGKIAPERKRGNEATQKFSCDFQAIRYFLVLRGVGGIKIWWRKRTVFVAIVKNAEGY